MAKLFVACVILYPRKVGFQHHHPRAGLDKILSEELDLHPLYKAIRTMCWRPICPTWEGIAYYLSAGFAIPPRKFIRFAELFRFKLLIWVTQAPGWVLAKQQLPGVNEEDPYPSPPISALCRRHSAEIGGEAVSSIHNPTKDWLRTIHRGANNRDIPSRGKANDTG